MVSAVGTLCTFILMLQQAISQKPVDWKAIDQVLGRSGNLQGEIYRVGFPRSDLHVTVGAVRVRPSLALGSWVAFKQTDDSTAMLMGDLVLLPAEVGSVIDALQRGGIEQTALHNHLTSESPHLVYLHIGGRGRPVALAAAVHEAPGHTGTPAPETSAAPPRGLDTVKIAQVLGVPLQRAPRRRSVSIRFRLHRCSACPARRMPGSIRSASLVSAQ